MPKYIDVPIDTNPESLQVDMFAFLQAAFPGWTPSDGQLDTLMIRAIAIHAAENRDVASRVPRSIFRDFGATMLNVPPIDATSSLVASTWTMVDNAGYDIQAGTQVGIRTPTGDLIAFQVLGSVVVPPGSTVTAAGAVTLIAVTPGAESAGLGGAAIPATLIDVLDFVASVVLTGATTGGQDAESEEGYLDRLSRKLQRLSLRPILPEDFADMALEADPSIRRVVAVDGYNPNATEIQTIDVDATGGTFTLTFTGQTTAAIAWNAAASDIEAALVALSNIAPGDVVVTGGPGPALWTVEFRGAYDGINVAQMTSNAVALTGGTMSVAHATTRQGIGVSSYNNERMVSVAGHDLVGNPLSAPIKAAVDALLQANREVNFIVHVIDPTYTLMDVTYTVNALPNYNAADLLVRINSALSNYFAPYNWGAPAGLEGEWVETIIVRFYEVVQQIYNVEGVDYIEAVTIKKQGGAMGVVDVPITGPAALTRPGVFTGTVNP